MTDFFNSLTASDYIQIIAIISSTFISIVSICIAVATLKQTNKITLESNRANIVFYIEKYRSDICHTLILKNFGNSSGKLLSLKLDPKLDYKKSEFNNSLKSITEFNDIYLAPGQSIKSSFSFRNYPDTRFTVKIEYETCGKIYCENYCIDLEYSQSIITTSVSIKNQEHALKCINESIREVSDKLI